MTLDQLHVLDMIIKTGSFRAASEKLNKAQSAVSYGLKKLEDELGVKIFSRDTYRPQLTAEGKAIYEKSIRLIEDAEDLRKLGKKLSTGHEPVVKLAVSAPFPISMIQDALRTFSEEQPCTKLDLNIEVMGCHTKVANDEADIAITELSPEEKSQFENHLLLRMPLVPVIGAQHTLIKNNIHITERELFKHVHIILKSTNDDLARKKGVNESGINWAVTDFLTKKQLLKGGLGWGYMPLPLVEKELESGVLKKLNVAEYQEVVLNLYAIRKRRNMIGPNAQLLWNKLSALGQNSKLQLIG